jgi:hypothetical protein
MGRGYLAIAKQIAEGNSITQDDVSYKLIEATRALMKMQIHHRCPAENENYCINSILQQFSHA